MTLASGAKLGPYEILSTLGAGGMGEVYRARDTRLERDVAIKVLPESFASDSDRLRRFEQEARAASQLNHPNIVTVHDFGTHEGSPYVVQELLEGETLGERLQQAPLAPRKAVEYALEIARGLAAAHEKGIVHRDLKPENIFLTSDGRVKILDFGLAKLIAQEPEASGISEAPTAAMKTRPGIVMGTVGYMSPEQVRGKPTDARTDIFSFGAILYEMVAGRRAFHRDTSAETIAAILKEEPQELATLGKTIPPALDRVVNHCLEKSPELRFQSAKDLAFALTSLSGSETATVIASSEKVLRRTWPLWAVVGAVGVAAILGAFILLRPSQRAERMQFAIPLESEAGSIAISADGRMLAFVARDEKSGEDMIYYERLGAPTASVLPGTEGASYPFWAPDDANLGFFANGKLKRIAITGGPPQVLATATHGRGGSWGSKGVIIYTPEAGGPMWRVNADGANPSVLTGSIYMQIENSHRWPVFLPDGNHFVFLAANFGTATDNKVNGIYLSSLDAKEKKLIVRASSNPGYADGYLYYMDSSKNLLAIPFNAAEGKAAGQAKVVSEQVTYQPSVFYGAFAAGGSGTVVLNASAASVLSVLTWFDRAGKELGRVGEPGVLANPSFSPDGQSAAVDVTDLKTANVDVWIRSLGRNTSSRFTFDTAEEVAGTWSRDKQFVAYRTIAGGLSAIAVKKASGLQAARPVFTCPAADDIIPNSWSADDKGILCSYQPGSGGSHLVVVDVATGKLTPFVNANASQTNGMISADGKWAAYASNESGNWEIYVTTFPGAQGKWQVSKDGGSEPRWSGDGREIFYIDPRGILTEVPVSVTETFSSGTPAPLFPIRGRAPISSTDLYTYDVSKDGKRFLVNRYVPPEHVEPLAVVLNATSGSQ